MSYDLTFDFSEAPTEFRPCPPGRYIAIISGEREVKNEKKTPPTQGMEVELTLQAALDGQDLEGINLQKVRVFDTQWLTEASRKTVQDRFLRHVFPDLVSRGERIDLATAKNEMVGRPVIVNLVSVTKDRAGNPLRRPRLEVTDYDTVTS